jgi:hypothetical protein
VRIKKRKVDVFSTNLKFTESNHSKPTFVDILKFMDGKSFNYSNSGKIFEFSLLGTIVENCIVGIIVTTQDKNIPPIRDKDTKMYSRIDIDPIKQGLAFANIFLYDIERNILLYEVNKSGCFPNQLIEFIRNKWKEANENTQIELSFPAIFKRNEYERMLKMNRYRKITVELYRPKELMNSFNEESESLENNILRHNLQNSTAIEAETMKLELAVTDKKLCGLKPSFIKGMVDSVLKIGHRDNIKILEVSGYTEDSEDKKSKQINMLADTFDEYFAISDVSIQTDVQEKERRDGIEKLYRELLPEIQRLRR